MKFVKPELTAEQLKVLKELISLAGIGCLKELALLNQYQSAVVQDLQKIGCVGVFKRKGKFMVLMSP
jgi:hypothetical protein